MLIFSNVNMSEPSKKRRQIELMLNDFSNPGKPNTSENQTFHPVPGGFSNLSFHSTKQYHFLSL